MSVLRWRPHTRADLLRELNDTVTIGITITTVGGVPELEPADDRQQLLEDLRLGMPLDQAPRLDPVHEYRRRESSTVYHSHPRCAAWPDEAPMVTLLGAPLLGYACRECARLWAVEER